jgi:hypothetical protein
MAAMLASHANLQEAERRKRELKAQEERELEFAMAESARISGIGGRTFPPTTSRDFMSPYGYATTMRRPSSPPNYGDSAFLYGSGAPTSRPTAPPSFSAMTGARQPFAGSAAAAPSSAAFPAAPAGRVSHAPGPATAAIEAQRQHVTQEAITFLSTLKIVKTDSSFGMTYVDFTLNNFYLEDNNYSWIIEGSTTRATLVDANISRTTTLSSAVTARCRYNPAAAQQWQILSPTLPELRAQFGQERAPGSRLF